MTASAVGELVAFFIPLGLLVGAAPVIATILISQLVATFKDIAG